MILTAHQPVYLPWLGLFHKIALADQFCFFDNVQFQKRDWNSRNKIKFTNGKADWLTVPVLNKDYLNRSFLDIEINNALPWQRKHWKSIELNYKKAPYFKEYAPRLQEFYEKTWQTLAELNYQMLLYFLKELGITVPVVRMKDYDFKGAKSNLVLDMCIQLKSNLYIFGQEGENYAEQNAFKDAGVRVFFQNYQHPTYSQINGPFISHLSIIDLLFNCGPKSLEILMQGNISKQELIHFS
ncbi:WbqC family protein [bacterium]|nr:WbqC family protein [bacterium]